MRRRTRRLLPAIAVLAACSMFAATCSRYVRLEAPGDAVLSTDWFDRLLGTYVELAPGVPLLAPGPDERLGTEDDTLFTAFVGDVDLVVRAGMTDFVGGIPNPSPWRAGGVPPEGLAEPMGAGIPIDFVVVASDGSAVTPYGEPTEPPYLEGLPVLVFAFADLDGDGFVGVTLLDGDPGDANLEEAELDVVGRRFAIFQNGRASGQLNVEVGGPVDAPVRIVLAASMWAGPFDPAYFQGNVPRGPAVFTHLPFIGRMDPLEILPGGAAGPPRPTGPDDLVGVEISDEFTPDPTSPLGEVFTLLLDGRDATTDVAGMRAGAFVRIGAAQAPDPLSFAALDSRPLRLGVSAAGQPLAYEILRSGFVADDGSASQASIRLVPLDRLGNVTDLAVSEDVLVSTNGVVRIVSPDADGDPYRETLTVPDAAGVEVVLDDPGGAFDDPNEDFLLIEGAGRILRVDLSLPDPDVDDSGSVDAADVDLLLAAADAEPEVWSLELDLDGNGRIEEEDAAIASMHLGAPASIP